MATIQKLPAGYTLTVTVAVGDPPVQVRQAEDSTVGAVLHRGARTFGPYLVPRDFIITGAATVSVAASTVATTFGGLLMSSDGAPVDAVAATVNVNPTGHDNGLTFTANEYGAGGNTIAMQYVDPGANDAALSVSVVGDLVLVSLATGSGGAITSTAAEVMAAVNASPAASAIVTASVYAGDSGTADDGSGVVTAMARTSLADGAGTGVGTALPGCICIDIANGAIYRNGGTLAAPAWHELAEVQA